MREEIKFRIMYKKYPNIWLKDEYTLRDLIEMDGAGFLGDDDVIEQYTGLKDKNGKEIYEGDIIKDNSDGDCLINSVFWCEKGGFWGVKPRSPFAERDWGWFIGRDGIEVIGNIHENPELLGGQNETNNQG